jgi:antitoxin ParD1/3/4
MTITLTDELEELINEKVRSGAYKSADEVVMASLRLLQAREAGLEALRLELARGIGDIQQGRFTAYATDAELDTLADEIISRGHERRDASGSR